MSGSNTQTIRNFLVRLGFQVNTNQQQQFTSAMRSATMQGVMLADTLEAAARKVLDFARSVAEGMEQMYYASQRTGATVQNLKAFDFAMGQIGLSAGDFTKTLDQLQEKINASPGMRGLVNQFIGVENATKSLDEQVVLLIEHFAAMYNSGDASQRAIAIAQAGFLGISQRELAQMANNLSTFISESDKAREIWKKFGLESEGRQKGTSEKSRDFMNMMRTTSFYLETAMTKIGDLLYDRLNPQMAKFNNWLIGHTPEIANAIEQIFTALTQVGIAIGSIVDALGGWGNATKTLLALWTLEKFSGLIRLLLTILGLMSPIVAAISVMAAAGLLIGAEVVSEQALRKKMKEEGYEEIENPNGPGWKGDYRKWYRDPKTGKVVSADEAHASHPGLSLPDKVEAAAGQIAGALANAATLTAPSGDGGGGGDNSGGTGASGAGGGGGGGGGGAANDNAKFEHDSWMQMSKGQRAEALITRLMNEEGYTRAQAVGIVSGLMHESSLVPGIHEVGQPYDVGGMGWSQSTADRRDARAEFFKSIGARTDDPEAEYKWLLKELNSPQWADMRTRLRSVQGQGRSAQVTAATIFHGFEAGSPYGMPQTLPGHQRFATEYVPPPGASNTAGGGSTVNLNQQTHITVQGANNPQATADAVAGRQGDVNTNLARTMRGAVR